MHFNLNVRMFMLRMDLNQNSEKEIIMSETSDLPEEGVYRTKDGDLVSIANVNIVDDVYLFELIESDDPEDIDAIATDLTFDDWPDIKNELGLEFVKPI